MATGFPGFSPKAISFLRQLKKNNSRDWFQPRKDQFETLLRQPMLALAAEIGEELRSFAVDHMLPPGKAVHRIYRDVRFSKDKVPYKTRMSAMWPRAGLNKAVGGCYYFSVSPIGVGIAGGIYMPGAAELQALRAAIIADHSGFRKILDHPSAVKLMGLSQGEMLARIPKGFAADHPAADLLRRKQFHYHLVLKPELATAPGLGKTIVRHFRAMSPALDFLNGILLKAAHELEGEEPLPKRPKPMF